MNNEGFWAVRYGGTTRISGKTADEGFAGIYTFGLVAESMAVKFLSTRVSDIQRPGQLNRLLDDPQGWKLMPERKLDKLGRANRSRCPTTLDDKGWPVLYDDQQKPVEVIQSFTVEVGLNVAGGQVTRAEVEELVRRALNDAGLLREGKKTAAVRTVEILGSSHADGGDPDLHPGNMGDESSAPR